MHSLLLLNLWWKDYKEIKSVDTPVIKGKVIDQNGRCAHWHSERDIVAIKFACCNEYYACYECHREVAGHEAGRWPKISFDTESAILCGSCRATLTISVYMSSNSVCPCCKAPFNPGCQLHWDLYFDVNG